MERSECLICGLGKLTKKVSDEVFEYKGKSVAVPGYVTYACDVCGEAIVDNASLKKSGKILKNFQREVDGFLSGEEIKKIRKKLGLTQEEISKELGGGLKSFARYESGDVCQSRAMDNLLRILDAYPSVINVILKDFQNKAKQLKVVHIKEYTKKSSRKSEYGYLEKREDIDVVGDLAYGS